MIRLQQAALLVVSFLGLVPSAAAALAGVPEVPVPGRSYPQAWFLFANDDLGLPGTEVFNDDHRTASANLGFTHERWMVLVDGAVLTDRERGRRTDELTVSGGYRVLMPGRFDFGLDDEIELVIGVGIRHSDDLGGAAIQNDFHDLIDASQLDLAYETGGTEYLAWFSGDWRRVAPVSAGSEWAFGCSLTLRGLATTEATLKLSPGVHAVVAHPALDAWVGLRGEWRNGAASTQTKRTVAEFEEGIWLSYGFAPWRHLLYQGGYNFDTGESYGAFGYVWPAQH